MDGIENRFLIKRITKPTDEDYLAALKIYSDATPQEIRTNTNEITHWLSKNDYDSFEMMIFVLYLDGIVIGFSQVTLIPNCEVAILDYISLKENYRLNTIFLMFLSMMQNYIASTNKQVLYYIAEISNKDNGQHIDRESTLYKRIVCLENFGKVESKYVNLPLGLDNFESEFDSLMYIKTNDKIDSINKETFLSIVKCICYDYYFAWYSEFLLPDQTEIYKSKLDIAFSNIKKAVTSDYIPVSYSQCPLFETISTEKTFGAIPSTKHNNVIKWPLTVVAILICPLLLALLYNNLFPLLNMQFGTVSTFVGGLIGTLVTSFFAYFVGKKKT